MTQIPMMTAADWEAAEEYREMCRKIGTCTDPMNVDKAKREISKLYDKMGWEVKNWILQPSPGAAKEWILKNKGKDYLNTNFYGSQEMYWIAFLKFGQDHMGIDYGEEKRELLDIWYEIALSCGWWFVIDQETCIICDRPCEVHLDEQHRLHNEKGWAIKYRDGFGVCVYNGIFIPEDSEWFIFNADQITVDKINKENNPHVRRIMVEIMGTDVYLDKMEMELVAADYIKVSYQEDAPSMPRFLMRSKLDQSQYLVGTDGSTQRVYMMPVDPDTSTCEEAHNSISPIKESKIIARNTSCQLKP